MRTETKAAGTQEPPSPEALAYVRRIRPHDSPCDPRDPCNGCRFEALFFDAFARQTLASREADWQARALEAEAENERYWRGVTHAAGCASAPNERGEQEAPCDCGRRLIALTEAVASREAASPALSPERRKEIEAFLGDHHTDTFWRRTVYELLDALDTTKPKGTP